jgi:hypothetical protein
LFFLFLTFYDAVFRFYKGNWRKTRLVSQLFSVIFYPNYALFTPFYDKNTGKFYWFWLLIVSKSRFFAMWQFLHGTLQISKNYFFQAFTEKNRLGRERTRKKLWKFGMFWKCRISMFLSLHALHMHFASFS